MKRFYAFSLLITVLFLAAPSAQAVPFSQFRQRVRRGWQAFRGRPTQVPGPPAGVEAPGASVSHRSIRRYLKKHKGKIAVGLGTKLLASGIAGIGISIVGGKAEEAVFDTSDEKALRDIQAMREELKQLQLQTPPPQPGSFDAFQLLMERLQEINTMISRLEEEHLNESLYGDLSQKIRQSLNEMATYARAAVPFTQYPAIYQYIREKQGELFNALNSLWKVRRLSSTLYSIVSDSLRQQVLEVFATIEDLNAQAEQPSAQFATQPGTQAPPTAYPPARAP